MRSTKYEGFSYPTLFLKSRGSIIRNNFLLSRTKKHAFALGNDFAKIKQNIYSIGILCSCIRDVSCLFEQFNNAISHLFLVMFGHY